MNISVQRIWLNTFGTKTNKPILVPFPQFLNNTGPLLKYKFQNWKLGWEKPLNSSYLSLPKILPCKSLCFWKCWESTLCPLPPWLESAVLRSWTFEGELLPQLRGLLMFETWCIYIVSIGQSQLPVGLVVFIGLGVWGSALFCRRRLLAFFGCDLFFLCFL